MGIPGPWHERLPHFRVDHVPASGDELQSEYFVPRHHALAAMRAVERLGERMAPLLWISEVRTIAADALWLSPCYGQACVGLHFSWRRDWPAVQRLLPLIEEALAPFEPRPHWGKLFTLPASQVQSRYPRLPDFRALLGKFDPGGKFRNAFLDACIFG
jgi:xylitol oxidase